jgi:hypothetical protein
MALAVCYINRLDASSQAQSGPRLVSDAIEDADLDSEGAVNLAFSEQCEEKRRGTLGSVKTSEDFARLLKTVLYRVINDPIHRERDGPIARRHGAPHPAETRDQS